MNSAFIYHRDNIMRAKSEGEDYFAINDYFVLAPNCES
jgi:hypothetical protein